MGEGRNDTRNVNDGKWHHFVAITDAATTSFGTALYIDGVMHSVQTNKAELTAGTSSLFIGKNPDSVNRQWTGEIDESWQRLPACLRHPLQHGKAFLLRFLTHAEYGSDRWKDEQ